MNARNIAQRITLVILLTIVTEGLASLNLNFAIDPTLTGYDTSNVFVAFEDSGVVGTTGVGANIVGNQWYSLSALGNASITQVTGRIYVELGNQTTGNAFTQPDEGIDDGREYVYGEWNFGGGANGNIDLSYINSFAVPLSLTSKNSSGDVVGTAGVHLPAGTLKQLLANSAVTPDNITFKNGNGQIYRVIGPSTEISSGGSTVGAWESYHDWTDYMQYLCENSKTAHITGYRDGNYDFTASIVERTAGSGIYDLQMVGTYDGQPEPGDVTVVIKAEEMSKSIYSENGPYYVNGVKVDAITNDVLGGAIGDLMAGVDDGFFGSTVLYQGEVIGDLISTGPNALAHSWFKWLDVGFGEVQSNSEYYNTYGNVIWNYADSYGTPFGERIEHDSPWITLEDGGTLLFTVQNPYAVPEPVTAGLLIIGAAALLRKKR